MVLTSPPTKGCRCGANDKENRASCVDGDQKRKSKCQCLRSKTGCGETCRCKNCSNPHGARQAAKSSSEKVKQKRRKRSHQQANQIKPNQQHKTSIQPHETDGEPRHGRWSDLETLTLIVLCNLLKKSGVPLDLMHLNNFYGLFRNFLCNKELILEFPIGVKELQHISAKFHHMNIQYL